MSRDRLIVEVHGIPAGALSRDADAFTFTYLTGYHGPCVSLTMPVRDQSYVFTGLPPFFDGLLPEGIGLEGLLRSRKLDRRDWMGQLRAVGRDVPGAVTLRDPKMDEL